MSNNPSPWFTKLKQWEVVISNDSRIGLPNDYFINHASGLRVPQEKHVYKRNMEQLKKLGHTSYFED